MPDLVPAPVQIPVPGGKIIEEYAGHAATGDDRVSIAHMVAPAGWGEPEQTPEFDEFTVVLEGTLIVDSEHGPTLVNAGQAIVARGGEWVRYHTDDGARYMSVCVPAFTPDTVHRADEDHNVYDPE